MPLCLAANATSERTTSEGSTAGSSGSSSYVTHEVQPPYSSLQGAVTGAARRCTRSTSTHSGSRGFHVNLDSTYSRAQMSLESSASTCSGSVMVETSTMSATPCTVTCC